MFVTGRVVFNNKTDMCRLLYISCVEHPDVFKNGRKKANRTNIQDCRANGKKCRHVFQHVITNRVQLLQLQGL